MHQQTLFAHETIICNFESINLTGQIEMNHPDILHVVSDLSENISLTLLFQRR